jgi:hypothetical protein
MVRHRRSTKTLSRQAPLPSWRAGFEKHAGEAGTGKLAALIRIENVRPAVAGQRFIQSLDQNSASMVIDNRQARTRRLNQSATIDEAMRHRDARDAHCPYLVRPDDRQVA